MKVGVIGAGKFGCLHISRYAKLNDKVSKIFVYDKQIEFARQNCNQIMASLQTNKKPEIEVVESLNELFNNVEAVSVVVPSDLHYEVAKKCLEAGKHVLVEKPFTMTAKDAISLINLADERGLKLGVGHSFRFSDTAKSLRYNFRLKHADVRYIELRFLQPSPPRADSDIIFNLGTHLLDILDFATRQDPKFIYSTYTDNYGVITLKYNTFIANLILANYYPEKIRDVLIVGKNNTQRYDVARSEKEPLLEELSHFLRCIEISDYIINTAHDAYFDVRLCELAQESNRTGREIPVTYEI